MSEFDKIRVLAVEDDESFRRVISSVLESTNRFEVYPCESGEEAVEALKRSRFDVIVLDHKMPGMSGLNVLQWLHEQKSTTPVLMLTAAGSENIAVEAMKLGAYDYMRKDQFDRTHFPITVSGVFERYLFKQDKERRERMERERERNLASLEILKNSISAFSEIVTMTLGKLAFLTEESERALRSHVDSQAKDDLADYFRKLREELETLAYASRSMPTPPSVTDDMPPLGTGTDASRSFSADKETVLSKHPPQK